jgi:hypothetical protein
MRFSPTVYIYGASPMEVVIGLLAPTFNHQAHRPERQLHFVLPSLDAHMRTISCQSIC